MGTTSAWESRRRLRLAAHCRTVQDWSVDLFLFARREISERFGSAAQLVNSRSRLACRVPRQRESKDAHPRRRTTNRDDFSPILPGWRIYPRAFDRRERSAAIAVGELAKWCRGQDRLPGESQNLSRQDSQRRSSDP